jgi:plasmid stabilization system protein ParE
LRFNNGGIIFLIQMQVRIMIDIVGLQQEIDGLAASIEAFGPAADWAERGRLRAQIRRLLEQLQRLGESEKKRATRPANGRVESAGENHAAAALLEDEEAAAKTLIPRVLGLRRYLTDTSRLDDPEMHDLLEEAISTAARYADEMQTARPVPGEIDHQELTRQIVSRFPKILAKLAK